MKRPAWLFSRFGVGLRLEIILNLALLMTGALLLVGFGIMKIHERDILEQKVRNGKIIVRSVQNSLDVEDLDEVDMADRAPAFSRVIRAALNADPEGIDEITILDRRSRVIASTVNRRSSEGIDDPDMVRAIAERKVLWRAERRRSFWFLGYHHIRFFSPLIRGGTIFGGIYVRLSLADVMESILVSQRLIMLLVLLDGVVIVTFGSFLLSRVIVNPLKALVKATEGIARGDYDQRIGLGEKNEIGRLAESFNDMASRLRESQEHVGEYIRSLEIANQQLRQTQMELIRSEKLASIGRFAAGIAHEVGNPLGAILGYTSILQGGTEDRSEQLDYLRRIEVEIQRINKIIRELLDFSRPSAVEIKEVNLNSVIERCLSLLSYQKSFENIETRLALKGDLPPIQADESQIQQVFVNLIINAVDAMPGGGILTLKTDDHILQAVPPKASGGPRRRKDDPDGADFTHLRQSRGGESPFTDLRRAGHVVCASVEDTGCGIQQEDLQKIFDPFFTTKDPNRGTGLGLSISLRIVESFGGNIEVESQVGRGSIFRAVFPAMEFQVGEGWKREGS